MATFPGSDIISLTSEQPRYDLGESVGPDLHLGALLEAAPGDIDNLVLGYRTAEGNAALRAAVAALHGVEADDVIITVGGMHALFLLAFILCDRGDQAVTTAPLFPLARNVLDAVGADVRVLRLSFDEGYRIDLDALAGCLTSETKLVSLASPQNPSGVAIPPDTLRAIVDLMAAKAPDAFLLLDTTYREAVYGDDPVAASGHELGPRVVSCASLSKCHGAPGLRLGWAICRDPALREQLLRGKFSTVISCSAVDEALALEVLRQREQIIDARRTRLAAGVAKTADWVAANASHVDWVPPDAGALCCVRLKPGVVDEAAVTRFYDVLAGEDVRVANGTWFGDDARVFRLGFGFLSATDLAVALDRLTMALDRTLREAA